MIVTVEGPSAAGKTTWIYDHFDSAFIDDELKVEDAPNSETSIDKVAEFWADVSKERWASVCTKEAENGMVICDADPFKLHYVWSLWSIGKVGVERWQAEKLATRNLFARGELGVSDLILINIPSQTVLEAQARNDLNRLRPSFNLHAQLSEPLRHWYEAIELLDPQRVQWAFPASDIDKIRQIGSRDVRSGIEIFDAIMANLPAS